MDRDRIIFGFVAVSLLALGSGCAPSANESSSAGEPPAVTSESGPLTATDRAEFLSGAGPVDDGVSDEFVTTESGLQYRTLRESDGKQPTSNGSVTVHYRGWLDDGREFDSSYSRGESISFSLGGVIPGWTEGLQLVGEGGMIELWIPPTLGYGVRGFPPDIPSNATLHFIVELLEVN